MVKIDGKKLRTLTLDHCSLDLTKILKICHNLEELSLICVETNLNIGVVEKLLNLKVLKVEVTESYEDDEMDSKYVDILRIAPALKHLQIDLDGFNLV